MLPRLFQHCHLTSDRDQSYPRLPSSVPFSILLCSLPYRVFLKHILPRINPRHLNPWLKLCIWETWPKTGVTLIQGKYQPHLLFSALGGRDGGTEPHLLKNSHLLRVPLPSPFWSSWSFSLMQGGSGEQEVWKLRVWWARVLTQAPPHVRKSALGLSFWREHPVLLWGSSPIQLAHLHSLPSHIFLTMVIHSSWSLFKEANK